MNRRVRPAEAVPEAESQTGDESRKRAIARAVWTEIHWLMPAGRTVAIAIDGHDIAVEFGPPGRAPQKSAENSPIPVCRRRP